MLTLYSLFDSSKSPLDLCLFHIFERWQKKWEKEEKETGNQNRNGNVLNIRVSEI